MIMGAFLNHQQPLHLLHQLKAEDNQETMMDNIDEYICFQDLMYL